MTAADAYAAFLATVDPGRWKLSLQVCEDDALRRGPSAGVSVLRALCIAAYLQWLAGESGDAATGRDARGAFDRLLGELAELHRDAASDDTRRAWALVHAWRGWRARARRELAGSRDLGAEMQLLVWPAAHAERALVLREHVLRRAGPVFPPALYFYCSTLIDLHATREAAQYLEGARWGGASALRSELQGRLCEIAGQWDRAAASYAASGWPRHRWRAQMCGLIARARDRQGADHAEPVIDEVMLDSLDNIEMDIDQAELARSTGFVNACLWNELDNWLLRLELGKLAFRRRRYHEADAHLQRSLALAPPQAHPAIAGLRFSNLTWLTGGSASQDLSLVPEALQAAEALLRIAGDSPRAASARVWWAESRSDPGPLPADVSAWALHLQAKAHEAVGNLDRAIACDLADLVDGCHVRTLMRLIERYSRMGFEASAEFLIERGLEESADDFGALAELAQTIAAASPYFAERGAAAGRIEQHLRSAEARALELSQTNHAHLIRIHDLFAGSGRQDQAEELLRRAAELAEGPAENLEVAIARRRSPWFAAARGDELGLGCLRRAERESRDRLERLQIAREWFHYGRPQRASRLLAGEGVFDDAVDFEPAHYIVALQCSAAVPAAQLLPLQQRAVHSLAAAIDSGAVLPANASLFVDRLGKRLGTALSALLQPARDAAAAAAAAAPAPAATRLEPGEWARWSQPASADDAGGTEGERLEAMFDDGAARLAASPELALRLCIAGWTFDRIESLRAELQDLRPGIASQETPISENATLDDDPRAVQISDLWREHLRAGDAAQREETMARIRAFRDEERLLVQRWHQRRRAAGATPLRRIRKYIGWLRDLLPRLITPRELQHDEPLLRELHACSAIDAQALSERLGGMLAQLDRDWGDAAAGPGAER